MAYAPAAPCVCVIFIYYSEIRCCVATNDRVKNENHLDFPDGKPRCLGVFHYRDCATKCCPNGVFSIDIRRGLDIVAWVILMNRSDELRLRVNNMVVVPPLIRGGSRVNVGP